MSTPTAQCPQCGGPVTFRWAGAVQTTCPYCASVLLRKGMDLEKVGVQSEPPPNLSRIQVGTRGEFGGKTFRVTGRIAYAWEAGAWNEWHLLSEDGRSGWLSDAQEEYAVTFAVPGQSIPPLAQLPPGATVTLARRTWTVASITRARYVGVEGELPFEYWDKDEVAYVDLRGDGGFATIDFSEDPPLLFAGQVVPFAALGLRDLRDRAEGPRVDAQALGCPNCGGAVEVRMPGESVNVVCPSCTSVLDATSPKLTLLQSYQARIKRSPKIPLGATGTMHGATWRVLGFQVRTVRVEGTDYPWDEYLLHAEGRGFRYLTEYRGHWNDAVVLHEVPKVSRGGRSVAHFRGEAFRHFQSAEAETTFVLGEFPWQVRAGDRAQAHDYVHPPRMLSREVTPQEQTWTLAEYTDGHRIWEAFRLPGKPPRPVGVFANQPSPHRGRATPVLATAALLLLALVAMAVWRFGIHRPDVLAQQPLRYVARGADLAENAGIIGPFEVTGRPAALGVRVTADLDNEWIFLNFALIEQTTGKVTTFGRELSYYRGTDSDGSWSEGSRSDDVRVPAVAPGRYVLRVDPEGASDVAYQVTVRHDVPSGYFFAIAFVLLLLPPAFALLRSGSFESQRWAESDYAPPSD